MNALVFEINEGICSDPSIYDRDECEKAGGQWKEPDVADWMDLTQRLTESLRRHKKHRVEIEKAAQVYDTAFKEYHAAFEAYSKEVANWRLSLSQLEDDYLLHCRPFKDTSMDCERQFREALHW